MSADAGRPLTRPNSLRLWVLLIAAALGAWIITYERMRGMDGGPGTDLGQLGWFLGVWVTMMAAMMLPSVAPVVMLFAGVSAQRSRQGRAFVRTWVFLAGYLAAWTAYGVVAFGLYRAISALDLGFLSWDEQGPIVAGAAIVAAGVYQLTPLKRICLTHCQTPLTFVMHHWREGRLGALRMGLGHGGYCVGCCWGLMLILFALGVMSLVWMVVIAALIFAEKVLPVGERLTRVLAVCFIALGIFIAVAPGRVPGLTEPGSAPAMEMQQQP